MKTVPLSRISLHAWNMLNIKFKYALKFFQKWSFVKRCCTETYALLAKKTNLCQTMNQWLTVQTILYIDMSIFHVLIWDTWREANIPAMFFLFFFFLRKNPHWKAPAANSGTTTHILPKPKDFDLVNFAKFNLPQHHPALWISNKKPYWGLTNLVVCAEGGNPLH